MQQRIVPVSYTPEFLKAINTVKKISSDWVIKQYNDKLSMRAQSDGKEIVLDIKAPINGFNYKNVNIGIKDFTKFFTVYSLVENPQIFIKESFNDITGDTIKVNSIIIDGSNTKIEFAAHAPDKLLNNSNKTELPPFNLINSFSFDISKELLTDIKRLTTQLVEDSAESGSRLDVFKPKGSSIATFRFKGISGNSFDKKFDVIGTSDEVNLNFDPLFFTWLTNDTYEIRVVNDTSRFMTASSKVLDEKNTEICTYTFIAGKLSSPAANPLEFTNGSI